MTETGIFARATDGPERPAGDPRTSRVDRRRTGRWWSRRWLVAGGATVLAASVGVVLAAQLSAAPACAAPVRPAAPLGQAVSLPGRAAPPTGSTMHSGKATFYDSKGAGGNCSLPAAPADRLYVALGPSEYSAGAACGGYLDVTGPKGKVRVLVMDQCPECQPGHLDLSKEAFARIGNPVQGVVPVTYRAVVDPPLPGPLTFRMKEGSSQWWFAVQVGSHGNPLRSVEARPAGGGTWRSAARQDYNYWLVDNGLGPGPYSIRLTDVYGHQAVATGIRMTPGQLQRSTVRMYGGSARPAASPRTAAEVAPSATAGVVPPSAAPPAAVADPAVADQAALAAAANPAPARCG